MLLNSGNKAENMVWIFSAYTVVIYANYTECIQKYLICFKNSMNRQTLFIHLNIH